MKKAFLNFWQNCNKCVALLSKKQLDLSKATKTSMQYKDRYLVTTNALDNTYKWRNQE